MIVNDVAEFQKLILMCELREKATGELREILDCVQFYSGMCGCNKEAKDAKYVECNHRYRNFVKNNLKSVTEDILRYESEVTFNHEGEFLAFISK
jgi:hypothetical protein